MRRGNRFGAQEGASVMDRDPIRQRSNSSRKGPHRRRGERRKVERKPRPPARSDATAAHVEEALDAGLEETFPASDPVSISIDAD